MQMLYVHYTPQIQVLLKCEPNCTSQWKVVRFVFQNKAVEMTWSPWGMY